MGCVSSTPADEPRPSRAPDAGLSASVFPAAEPTEQTQPGPHVFISHAGEQKLQVVDVIRARLAERHPELDVFADDWSLQSGDEALARIAAACRRTTVGAWSLP